MPIFAIANTNITFESGMVEGLASNLGMGVLLGLFVGKPVGIFLMSWLSVRLKLAELPLNTTWIHVLGLGLLGGIGFTMSIFIALLSFTDVAFQTEAKFAILVASVLSGVVGYILLNANSKRKKHSALPV
jgi:NhaA family Na+:H+ antiporter